MPNLTLEQKVRIVDLYELGKTMKEISEIMGIATSTVGYTVKHFKDHGTVNRTKGSGSPRSFDEYADMVLKIAVVSDREVTLEELQSRLPIEASTATISHELHNLEYSKRMAVKKPFINEKHRKDRLRFAREHKDWTLDQWRKVIWTDESSIEIGKDVGARKAWRKPHEKYLKACLRPTHRSGRTSLMVWGGITYGKKTKLTLLPKGKRKSHDFVEYVYKPVLLDFMNNCEGAVLMEDNAPIHTAGAATNWRDEHSIQKLQWPAQSPDLNPIENLWMQLKRDFFKYWHKQRPQHVSHVILSCIWNRISIDKVNKLIDTMPKRMQMVIDAKGYPIKF